MPYSGADDESIPENVPDEKKAQWVEVWNSTYNSCIDDGGSKKSCETKAFKSANGVIEERSVVMSNAIMKIINELSEGIMGVFKSVQERAVSVSSIGNEVFEQFYNQGAWLNDLYIEDGAMFAVASEGGKLFRASVDIDEATGDIVLGEMQEVIAKFDAVSRAEFRTTDDGKVRMISVSATSVINKNGQIDSRDLFDSMSDYMEKTGKRIPRTFFHKGPEFRTGDIIGMYRDENVLITVTEFDDSEFAQREIESREKDSEYWGDSIEFDPVGDPEMLDVGDGITIPVYRAGIPIAVSTVPAEHACSLYADKFSISRQEVKRMTLTDIERTALIKQFDGDEKAVDQWLEDNVSPINRNIAEVGQITRAEGDTDDEPAEGETAESESTEDELEVETEEESSEEAEGEEEPEEEPKGEPEADSEPDVIVEFDDEMAQQVAASVVESNPFTEFRDSVNDAIDGFKTTLEELGVTVAELQAVSVARTKELKKLQESEEGKKKEWLEDLPRNTQRHVQLHRPSEDGSTDKPEERTMPEVAAETVGLIEEQAAR